MYFYSKVTAIQPINYEQSMNHLFITDNLLRDVEPDPSLIDPNKDYTILRGFYQSIFLSEGKMIKHFLENFSPKREKLLTTLTSSNKTKQLLTDYFKTANATNQDTSTDANQLSTTEQLQEITNTHEQMFLASLRDFYNTRLEKVTKTINESLRELQRKRSIFYESI